MTVIFECDRRFNVHPGIYRDYDMTRVWWLWFAFAWLHIPFEMWATKPKVWRLRTGMYLTYEQLAERCAKGR